MRISDWSSDVCSSDLFGGRERQRRVPAQLRGIIDVAAGQPPYPVVAIRAARAGAQMIDQMAETGNEAFDQPRTRRSEEHTSELQSLMRISYAVFCVKKTNNHRHLQYSIVIKNTIIYLLTI